MGSRCVQLVGLLLALLGLVGSILICALPMWKVSAFVGSNIVVAQITWQGLWMNCVYQSTGQMQCMEYWSVLALSQDLQVARALVTVGVLAAGLAVGLVAVGGVWSTLPCSKRKMAVSSGVASIGAGVLCLVPVTWTAYIVITNFNDPTMTDAQRQELGPCIYIGWITAGLLIVAGVLLCCSCRTRSPQPYRVYH